ncbi:MAG: hypothetical protein WB511_08290 [Nitrososphaeraceae archaeon]
MQLTRTAVTIFAIVAATGLISAITVSQPADAWHSLFASKKECTNLMKSSGNTTAAAQLICNKLIPH